MKSYIHLNGLNGLRAIAALTVLISHVFNSTFGNWGVPSINLPIFSSGVTLFFVISGFLITYLLLLENQKTQTISIKKFYIRRILRIWPIYYLFIIISIVMLLILNRSEEILNSKLFFYVFFTANIPFLSATGIWIIVHYWSIGVEEQFYLFWPLVVRFFKNNLLYYALLILVLWLVLKYGSWFIFTNKSLIYKFFNVTSFHYMMLGAIAAILYFRKNVTFNKITQNIFLQYAAWIFTFTAGFFINHIPAVFREEIIAIVSVFLIMGQVDRKTKYFDLENSMFDFVGKISYGIYIIHPLVIFVLSSFWRNININLPVIFNYLIIYLSVILITIGLAWLSYNYFEKPFLNLKSKFAIINSKN